MRQIVAQVLGAQRLLDSKNLQGEPSSWRECVNVHNSPAPLNLECFFLGPSESKFSHLTSPLTQSQSLALPRTLSDIIYHCFRCMQVTSGTLKVRRKKRFSFAASSVTPLCERHLGTQRTTQKGSIYRKSERNNVGTYNVGDPPKGNFRSRFTQKASCRGTPQRTHPA